MFGLFNQKKSVRMGSLDANNAVRTQLNAHGDDGVKPRHVIHFAYPLGASMMDDLAEIKNHLNKLGYKVKHSSTDSGLAFEADQTVARGVFDQLTDDLVHFFDKFDWAYDGWECAVCHNEKRSGTAA